MDEDGESKTSVPREKISQDVMERLREKIAGDDSIDTSLLSLINSNKLTLDASEDLKTPSSSANASGLTDRSIGDAVDRRLIKWIHLFEKIAESVVERKLQTILAPNSSETAKAFALQAAEEKEITDALSKIPDIKKVYCAKENLIDGPRITLTVIHSSPDHDDESSVILDEILSLEDRLDGCLIRENILRDSDADLLDTSNLKLLLDRD